MVIQPTMTPTSITSLWPETKDVFQNHQIEINNKPLEETCEQSLLNKLILLLNETVGSSEVTCVEGG